MFSGLNATEIITFVVSLIAALTVHEAMHAYASHALGDRTAYDEGRLTLNPIKHIDFITSVLLPVALVLLHLPPFFIARPVPFNPNNVRHNEFGVAIVGLAGPFSNFLLAFIAALFAKFAGIAIGTETFNIASIFILVNLSFFVFNMIPFPPLDGSRLLYALAPDSVREVMERMESGGVFIILVFMFVVFPFLSTTVGNVVNSMYTFLLSI